VADFSRGDRATEKKLFYLGPVGMLMAVAVSPARGTFTPGPPKPIFRTRMLSGTNHTEYDVAPDGRFLVNETMDEAGATPITVFLNWTPQ
jgi:hypothetical protein